jgi:hypothetical protein
VLKNIKKYELALIFLIFVSAGFILAYQKVFYVPPLLDQGKRNMAEKTIDFLYFSWHMSKSSFYLVFLKKNITETEYAKAAWYKTEHFPKLMNMESKDLYLIAKVYREKNLNRFVRELYSYFLIKGDIDLDLLKTIEAFYLEQKD